MDEKPYSYRQRSIPYMIVYTDFPSLRRKTEAKQEQWMKFVRFVVLRTHDCIQMQEIRLSMKTWSSEDVQCGHNAEIDCVNQHTSDRLVNIEML